MDLGSAVFVTPIHAAPTSSPELEEEEGEDEEDDEDDDDEEEEDEEERFGLNRVSSFGEVFNCSRCALRNSLIH
jgi:hypothetical protein